MTFSKRLHSRLQPIWRNNHNHPFVVEMGAGSLDKEKFRFFLIQDYLYLIEYAKLFAIGVTKAKDVKVMEKFSGLLDATMNEEMTLHRQYAKRFGISERELEQALPSPVTLAYTHYMLHVGQNGSLSELVAALLPCAWSYREIGRELAAIPGAANHPLYGDWIRMYSSAEFGQTAQWCIDLLDELTVDKTNGELANLEEIFLTTTRFEYMFWDMAYHETMWPVHD